MNPEQWLSLKWNGGSTMSDRWLNQSKIIQEFLLEGFWTLLDFGNSIREVLNFLKKNLNRNLITNLGCKFSNYFSIAYFYILFYFTKEENKCKT